MVRGCSPGGLLRFTLRLARPSVTLARHPRNEGLLPLVPFKSGLHEVHPSEFCFLVLLHQISLTFCLADPARNDNLPSVGLGMWDQATRLVILGTRNRYPIRPDR
jgi:hypothetical protein